MEYISAEEFLKQDEKIQEVFKEYFDHKEMLFENGIIYYGSFKDEIEYIPLLTEGQLREFIEDNKCGKVDITYDEDGYKIGLTDETGLYSDLYNHLDKDLLQAYWKVAVQIVKEQLKNSFN